MLVIFPATSRKKRSNPHLPRSHHHGQEMRVINVRAGTLLPYLTVYGSFHVPAPSET